MGLIQILLIQIKKTNLNMNVTIWSNMVGLEWLRSYEIEFEEAHLDLKYCKLIVIMSTFVRRKNSGVNVQQIMAEKQRVSFTTDTHSQLNYDMTIALI